MPTRTATRPVLVAALLVWLCAVGVATAWIGGLGSAEKSIVDPDYMWQPLAISGGTWRVLGLVATIAAAALTLLGFRWFKSGRLSRVWLAVMLPAGGLAAYAGFCYGVATAPVIGANIGGGLVVLGAIPFAIVMVVTSIWMTKQARAR